MNNLGEFDMTHKSETDLELPKNGDNQPIQNKDISESSKEYTNMFKSMEANSESSQHVRNFDIAFNFLRKINYKQKILRWTYDSLGSESSKQSTGIMNTFAKQRMYSLKTPKDTLNLVRLPLKTLRFSILGDVLTLPCHESGYFL